MSINGAGNNAFSEHGHKGLEEKAVFALTQLMTLYLDKRSSEKQWIGRETPAPVFRKGREFEIEARPNSAALHRLGLLDHPHPLPGRLKNEMRAIGAALYEKTNSTEAMSDVLYQVMENFPNKEEVVGVLDDAFDGIGGWWA